MAALDDDLLHDDLLGGDPARDGRAGDDAGYGYRRGLGQPAAPGWRERLRDALADRLPVALRGGRVALSPAAAAGLALVALVAALLTAWYAWHGRPRTLAVGPAAAATATGAPVGSLAPTAQPSSPAAALPPVSSDSGAGDAQSAGPSAGASATGQIVVDVAGKVAHPGVATLAAGSRVIDAVTWAGGPLAGTDTSNIDLARLLTDGEQVYVGPTGGGAGANGTAGPAPATGSPGGGSAVAAPGAPIDLNTATADQLDTLPGIGPVLASRIIDWRTVHGRFSSVDELRQVSGVGSKKFDSLRSLVRV